MNFIITPSIIQGKIKVITSKSFSQRAVICACITKQRTILKDVNMCDDVKNTINIMRQIVPIEIKGDNLIIDGGFDEVNLKRVFIDESASTLRFLLPILSFASKKEMEFVLGDRLFERGIEEYQKIFGSITLSKNSFPKNLISVKKIEDKKIYDVSTLKSSQYVSGMLFLAIKLDHDTIIKIDNTENSIDYIDLTIKVLNSFGYNVKRIENTIYIYNKKHNKSVSELRVPYDPDFLVFVSMLNKLGNKIEYNKNAIDRKDPQYELYEKIESDALLDMENMDISKCPDSFMLLALYLSRYNHKIIFTNTSRLMNKETDRMNFVVNIINKLGGKAYAYENSIVIEESIKLKKEIPSFNDHRIVFFAILVSYILREKIVVKNAECISKSYPNFLSEMIKSGMNIKAVRVNKKLSFKYKNKLTKIVIGESDKELKEKIKNKKTIVVTDQTIYNIYKNEILKLVSEDEVYVTKNINEKIKTLEEANNFIEFLLKNNIQKSDLLVAFGGGTITDFVGFVSSVYKRGINYISVPTTLLASVDAAIGGKTALNINNTKNAIGSFYNPMYIYINPLYIETLPIKEKRNGIAEIVKISSLMAPNLFFDILDSELYQNIEKWIYEAVKLKLAYVLKDFEDRSERMALNFGHTYAHMIELSENISHGEAVAKGMIIESNNKEIKKILKKYNFNLEGIDQKITKKELLANDKKANGKKIKIVKLNAIGDYTLKECDIDELQW